jgi:hypothetical protein
MIRITCTNCQKPLSLDETKLPMREVAIPCPVCKTKLVVDRRQIENAQAPHVPVAVPVHDAGGDEDDHENELGAKALIVGMDNPALRQAAKLVGFLPVFQPDAAKARELFNQEIPHIVFLHPPQMTAPPLDSIAPIVSVMPSERRRSFFVLVADNLRTLDGNAAFLYGVNLVVASKDLPQFPQIYRDASAAHERLYASMNAIAREKHL